MIGLIIAWSVGAAVELTIGLALLWRRGLHWFYGVIAASNVLWTAGFVMLGHPWPAVAPAVLLLVTIVCWSLVVRLERVQ